MTRKENTPAKIDDKETLLASVYDEETGKMIQVTKEFRQKAEELDNSIEEDVIGLAFKLFVMRTQKYYLALGYTSWTEYVLAKHMSLQHARKLLTIGKKFGELVYGDEKNSEQNGERNRSPVSAFEKLGLRKLYAIASLPDEEFKKMVKSGQVETEDGGKLTWEDVKEMVVKEVEKEVSKIRKKYQEKLGKTSSKAIQLEEEVKKLQKERDAFEERLQRLKALEEKYGPGAMKLEEKLEYLRKAYKHFGDFLIYLQKANVEMSDPVDLIVELQRIIVNWEMYRDIIRENYGHIIMSRLDRNYALEGLEDFFKVTKN